MGWLINLAWLREVLQRMLHDGIKSTAGLGSGVTTRPSVNSGKSVKS